MSYRRDCQLLPDSNPVLVGSHFASSTQQADHDASHLTQVRHNKIYTILFNSKTFTPRSSGVLKPGEMCLVLGCPGSGCTTFLKTIANQREGYANVAGNVLYAGMDAAEMAKFYKGEVVYNEEGKSYPSIP